MARPRNAQFLTPAHRHYVAGGAIAILHKDLEAELIMGTSTLPAWTAHADATSPTEELLRHVSRAAGILALVAGAAAVLAYLF